MEELKAQAESLGIDVDGRWSEKRIQAEIDKALNAPAPGVEVESPEDADMASTISSLLEKAVAQSSANKSVAVTNMRDNPNKRLGLKGRGQIVLTADQLSNKQLMARIMHGVETGVLSIVW